MLDFYEFEDQAFNEYFDALEYESSNFITTLDLMFFMLIINLALIVGYLLLDFSLPTTGK